MDKIYAAIQLLESGGPVMIPLFILSVITIAIAIERGIYYKRHRKKSQSFFSYIEGAAKSGDWKVAEEVCEHSQTAISRIIAAGLQDDSTEESMKSAFSEQMALESAAFQRYLDYLSAIVTVAPLLGLLGTVTGMITTFSVLDGGMGASAITGGVGEALVATATGLCVAIIAFAVYTFFTHQLDTIVSDTERLCITVVMGKKKSWGRN